MRERDGGGVADIPSDDATRKVEGGKMELDHLSHGGGRTKNISDIFTDQGRAKGLPSGGLPGKGRDTDGNEDASL